MGAPGGPARVGDLVRFRAGLSGLVRARLYRGRSRVSHTADRPCHDGPDGTRRLHAVHDRPPENHHDHQQLGFRGQRAAYSPSGAVVRDGGGGVGDCGLGWDEEHPATDGGIPMVAPPAMGSGPSEARCGDGRHRGRGCRPGEGRPLLREELSALGTHGRVRRGLRRRYPRAPARARGRGGMAGRAPEGRPRDRRVDTDHGQQRGRA